MLSAAVAPKVASIKVRNPRLSSERCGVKVSSNNGASTSLMPGPVVAGETSLSYKRGMGQAKPRGLRARAAAIFERLAAAAPSPQTELSYVNPYTLLVAVVLSAQATDAGVNKATRSLFAVA